MPSDCSVARKDFAILRGELVVRGSEGMTGRPRNIVVVVVDILLVFEEEKRVFRRGVVMCFDSFAMLSNIKELFC